MIASKVSKRYAKALFSLGQEDGKYKQYGQDLMEFTQFCQENREFRRVITNPIFGLEDRKKVLQIILEKSSFSGVVNNFLNLLLDKNRIGAIDVITDYYARLTDGLSNIARAEIITARPLKAKVLGKLEKSLAKLTSKKIESEVKEERDLIGGIVVKIGDLVLDGSIRAQSEGLRESLIKG